MNVVDKALATQIANIEKKTGKSLADLVKLVKASGLAKHGEIRDMLKTQLGLGHGDANTVAHMALIRPAFPAQRRPHRPVAMAATPRPSSTPAPRSH